MYAVASCIDRNRDRHIFDFKLMDRLHTQIFKRDHFRTTYRFRNKICGATDSHKINRFVFCNRIYCDRSPFCFPDHS